MKKLYYSDLANIPPDVCPSSLDENLVPVDPSNTGHHWDDSTDPVTCAECGTKKGEVKTDLCEDCAAFPPDTERDGAKVCDDCAHERDDEALHAYGHHPKCAELIGGENGGHCNCEDGKILA